MNYFKFAVENARQQFADDETKYFEECDAVSEEELYRREIEERACERLKEDDWLWNALQDKNLMLLIGSLGFQRAERNVKETFDRWFAHKSLPLSLDDTTKELIRMIAEAAWMDSDMIATADPRYQAAKQIGEELWKLATADPIMIRKQAD